MKFYKIKNRIIKKNNVGEVICTDEPEFIKDLEQNKKIKRLISDGCLYTIYVSDCEFDDSKLTEIVIEDVLKIYQNNFPTKYYNKETNIELTSEELLIINPENIRTEINFSDINSIEKEARLKLG